jgi:hypothetical protein
VTSPAQDAAEAGQHARAALGERARSWSRLVGIAGAAGLGLAVSLYLSGRSIGLILEGAPAVDWEQYVEASR